MTEVSVTRPGFSINFKDRGLVLGSCFAEHVGRHLELGQMNVVTNPFGVTYNPAAMAVAITRHPVMRDDLVEYGGLWHCMLRHGDFSDVSADQVLEHANRFDPSSHNFDYVIITLGTAWVYEYEGRVVANCHKIPASNFVRRRLSEQECYDALCVVRDLYPNAHFIYTISPIRHIKDGLADNFVSKATLRMAVQRMMEQEPVRNHYFPAYEIMMDELRDYRFYDQDMVHPTPLAVAHILDVFTKSYIDEPSQEIIVQACKLQQAMEHRPLHKESNEYVKFQDYIARQQQLLDMLLTSKK